MNEEKTIVCRPTSKARQQATRLVRWTFGLMFFLCVGLTFFEIHMLKQIKSAMQWQVIVKFAIVDLVACLAMCIPAILLRVWANRAQIIASPSGLRWRGMGRWRQVNWSDVTDYYDDLIRGFHYPVCVASVRMPSGVLKIPNGWENSRELMRFVQEQATASKSGEWGIYGIRPQDDPWPNTFQYRWKRDLARLSLVALILCSGLALNFYLCYRDTLRYADWTLLAGAIIGSPLNPLYLPILIRFGAQVFHVVRDRRDQKITVDLNGIVFEDKSQKLSAKWSQVQATYVSHIPGWLSVPGRYVVVTEDGKIDFTYLLSNNALLMSIINTCATEAQKPIWDDLDDVTTVYNKLPPFYEDDPRIGTRVYHFRTRTTRALLWLLGTCFVASILHQLLVPITEIAPRNDFARTWDWSWTLIFGLAFSWSLWRYRSAAIITTEEAIIQKTPFGSITIPLSDIKRTYLSGRGHIWFGNIIGTQKRIRFWQYVSNFKRLEACLYLRSLEHKL